MSETIIDELGKDYLQLENSEIMSGVVPAIVSNLKDPEQLGRIKVNFPWLTEESETDWIRVLSFYAGSDRGVCFPPEVGDEVLVVFQKGNINAPYVIGSLWSSKNKPPEKNADGKNNIKIIKTKAGHTITFNDDTQTKKAKIEIKSGAGNIITLDDAAGKEKIEIKDKGGSIITLDAVKKAITIESGMKLDIKAQTINIEAKTALNLKGAMLKVEASGIAEIKGSMVKIN
ncbi:MAG: phage baseplate assembly protein V [Candidatus Aminicenantes bacterium]|nr:MAG: phage baseplate assembly protein V [Candidatus Aminicenantes bacterium]